MVSGGSFEGRTSREGSSARGRPDGLLSSPVTSRTGTHCAIVRIRDTCKVVRVSFSSALLPTLSSTHHLTRR